MDIRNRKGLRQYAAAALADNSGNPRLTVLVYVAVTALSSLLVSILTMILDNRISQTGGLGNLGLRSILTTIRQAAPLILGLALMGLDLGRQAVSLRLARRQQVEPRDLLKGYPRFGALLRATILQVILYFLLLIVAVNIGSILFMMTPFANNLYGILADVMLESDAIYEALASDPAFLNEMFRAMLPAYPICIGLFLLLATPVFYRYRMTNYCLLDASHGGALMAMGESIRMTKGNRFALFKLDLSFWWFWLGQMICTAVLYGDMICAKLGVALPWNATVSYYVFYVAAMVLEGALYYLTLNRVDATYAAAYDALRPQTQAPQGGVVLGNIFDLAKKYRDEQ